MNVPVERPVPSFGRAVALHSLGWLFAANVVGVWLAIVILWPAAGDLVAPFTYGRWVPLHLNWQLYGWCSLPLVGGLLAWCLDRRHPAVDRHARLALGAWSLALGLGGIAWLGGMTSGRLFLDWHGWARPLLPAAMHILWAFLAAHTWWRRREFSPGQRCLRLAVLGALLVVPSVLAWSAGRATHPAVNPDSGGATGAALLGSTLGIVTIYLGLPAFLGLPARGRNTIIGFILAASWLAFGIIDRGNVSHHAPSQVAALAVLLLWIPLLPLFWERHDWPPAARAWLRGASAWWALLVVGGWISFLPGVSEAQKFTHGLVGHAHLAMAGLVTSVNGAMIVVLSGRPAPRAVFQLWQAGCVVYVAAMLALGSLEAGHVAALFRSEGWTQALLGARLAGGVAMAGASAGWVADFLRR